MAKNIVMTDKRDNKHDNNGWSGNNSKTEERILPQKRVEDGVITESSLGETW